MNAKWLYTVDPTAEEPIMLINNHIGFDPEDGEGIDGGQFQCELLALDGLDKKRIQVWINSPGGSVLDGYNIYSAILKSKTKVDTYCIGMAASIAGVIFQAGRDRIMSDYGFLMYHNPTGANGGKIIEMMKDSIAKMTGRSGKDEADILKMMSKETFINASEALEYGLCDRIEASNEHNKKRMTAVSTTAYYKEANLVLNSLIIPQKKIIKMIKVTNKLNLNPEANEDAIVSEIVAIQNKAKDEKKGYEDKIKDLEDKKKELEKEIEDLKKEAKDAKDAKDKAEKDVVDMKKEKEDAEDKSKEEEAKNVVNKYVQLGKIKNEAESIAFWTAIHKADPATAKKQLDALPLNKIGVNIHVAGETQNIDALKSVALVAMADIRNKLNL